MAKAKLLFVCTGNSARSQMAEALARHYGGDLFEVFSAGLEPSRVNPRASAVMAEKGISLAGQWSKGLDAVPLAEMDLVITLCADADARCPVVSGRFGRRHWPLDDPAEAEGSEEHVLAAFRSVRDELDERIRQLAQEFRAHHLP